MNKVEGHGFDQLFQFLLCCPSLLQVLMNLISQYDGMLESKYFSPQLCYRFVAVFAYAPQNDDELELNEGDIVFVVEQCTDGWFVGTSERTRHFGTFPGNYVTAAI